MSVVGCPSLAGEAVRWFGWFQGRNRGWAGPSVRKKKKSEETEGKRRPVFNRSSSSNSRLAMGNNRGQEIGK